jgi:glycosyltransferase involved in cell wall biosynthesis
MNPLLLNLSFLIDKPTGLANYATQIFPYLKSLNPTLLTAQTIANEKCHPVPSNMTPEQGTKGHFNRLLWTQLQLPRIYQRLSPSLLFSPVPEAPLYSRCRYVVTVHDLIPLRFPRASSPLTPYFRYYIPQVLAQAQHVICNSIATAQDITRFFNIPENKITSIPLAHDAHRFRHLNLPSCDKGRPYFLYIGRHETHKNVHRLVTAFAALPNCQDYELWLVGSKDKRYTPGLVAYIDQLGISGQVKFFGYLPPAQLPIVINQALALVFPSLWEGFGFPVLEGMACGTPVITSNLSSLPEVAGDAALLVDPYSPEEITEAMQTIAHDSALRSRLSTLGIARAKQFNWASTGQATAAVLQKFV